mgnify:CR=1 FL=1
MSNPQYIPVDMAAEQFIDEMCQDIGTEDSEFRKGWLRFWNFG